MEVKFTPKTGGPENLLCDAEVHFGKDTPLAGMKLVGLSVWRGANGDASVTFPARSYEAGADGKKYYDFLRAADGPNAEVVRGVKAWVLQEYERQIGPVRAASSTRVETLPAPVAVAPAVAAPAR